MPGKMCTYFRYFLLIFAPRNMFENMCTYFFDFQNYKYIFKSASSMGVLVYGCMGGGYACMCVGMDVLVYWCMGA